MAFLAVVFERIASRQTMEFDARPFQYGCVTMQWGLTRASTDYRVVKANEIAVLLDLIYQKAEKSWQFNT